MNLQLWLSVPMHSLHLHSQAWGVGTIVSPALHMKALRQRGSVICAELGFEPRQSDLRVSTLEHYAMLLDL